MGRDIVKFGEFYCKICNKNILINILSCNTDFTRKNIKNSKRFRQIIFNEAKNRHWYDVHYNCAVCGKWISPKERKLIDREIFKILLHGQYCFDRMSQYLLRVHASCIKNNQNLI